MADLNFTMISTAFLVRNQLEVYTPHPWEELQLLNSLEYILLKATIEDLWRKNLWRKIPGRELFTVVEDCWAELLSK